MMSLSHGVPEIPAGRKKKKKGIYQETWKNTNDDERGEC